LLEQQRRRHQLSLLLQLQGCCQLWAPQALIQQLRIKPSKASQVHGDRVHAWRQCAGLRKQVQVADILQLAAAAGHLNGLAIQQGTM
jgi:hypothetical protein